MERTANFVAQCLRFELNKTRREERKRDLYFLQFSFKGNIARTVSSKDFLVLGNCDDADEKTIC